MTAVRNSMLPIDAVTYFSEEPSDNVSELRVIGMTIPTLGRGQNMFLPKVEPLEIRV